MARVQRQATTCLTCARLNRARVTVAKVVSYQMARVKAGIPTSEIQSFRLETKSTRLALIRLHLDREIATKNKGLRCNLILISCDKDFSSNDVSEQRRCNTHFDIQASRHILFSYTAATSFSFFVCCCCCCVSLQISLSFNTKHLSSAITPRVIFCFHHALSS